jgi:hypothetical protein
MRLLFVGDGERDAATVPHLVETILGIRVERATLPWARLNGAGRGYRKKVQFAVRQAIDAEADRLVAVVDRDKEAAGVRLGEMRQARDADRMKRPSYPTACGEANPHGEAWLLDDPVAVRDALGLANEVKVTPVHKTKDPKAVLNDLIRSSRKTDPITHILGDIAKCVDPSRCAHRDETGLEDFMAEVQSELGPLVKS